MSPEFWLKVILLLLPISALAEVEEREFLITYLPCRSLPRAPFVPHTHSPFVGYCERRWFGTAPLCGGVCPDTWHEVLNSALMPGFFGKDENWCGDPVPGLTVHCEGSYGLKCLVGGKSLCEHCSDLNERI